MNKLTQRHLVFRVLLFTSVLVSSSLINAGETKMTELTKNMQVVCVGRFVIEIPLISNIIGWDQKVDDTKIEVITPPAVNQSAFDHKVVRRVEHLRNSPQENDGFIFKEKSQLTSNSDLLVSYSDSATKYKSGDRLYSLDVLFWRPSLELKFHGRTTGKFYDEGINKISNLVKSFSPLPTKDIDHLPAGLCIESGIMLGNAPRGEGVAVSGRISEYPGVGFSFSTQTVSVPRADPTMFERIAKSFNLNDQTGNAAKASSKTLRQRKRTLNGQQGEEMVMMFDDNGEISYKANAEFYAAPKTLDKPSIKVSLGDQSHDDNTHVKFSKNLSEKEFLTLWDVLLDGIKLRPGAL
jgi:hypothetical protein